MSQFLTFKLVNSRILTRKIGTWVVFAKNRKHDQNFVNRDWKFKTRKRVYIRVFKPEQTQTLSLSPSFSFLFLSFLSFFLFFFFLFPPSLSPIFPFSSEARRRSALLQPAHGVADPPRPGPDVGRLGAAQKRSHALMPCAVHVRAHQPPSSAHDWPRPGLARPHADSSATLAMPEQPRQRTIVR